MDIGSSHLTAGSLLLVDAQRDRSAVVGQTPMIHQQPKQTVTKQAVASFKETERIASLYAKSQQNPFSSQILDQRSRRAAKAYESLAQSQERDYVRAVLGIDAYA